MTVGRTLWTGDQVVARTLLTAPGDCGGDDEVGGMNGFGRGNRTEALIKISNKENQRHSN
jgi:hypothetical protein